MNLPHCARCGRDLLLGDFAHGGQVAALDGSFVAIFELCTPCHEAILGNDALRAELHLQLRDHLRQLLAFAVGDVGGQA